MIRMTDRASERVDEYVSRVRRALAPHPDVDADEVADDVRAHVVEALRDRPEPVGEDDVAGVLDRLGSPGRWAPAEDLGGWRGVMARIRRGPDDWRLAYVCFAVSVLAFVTIPLGVGILLMIPAFVLARGAVALAEERGESLGAQRWLVYPALIFVYVWLALALLTAPIALSPVVFATGGLIDFLGRSYDFAYPEPGTSEHWLTSAAWVVTALGAWWSALGGIAATRPGWVRSLFRPFADRFRRGRAWIAVLIGILVALVGVVTLVLA